MNQNVAAVSKLAVPMLPTPPALRFQTNTSEDVRAPVMPGVTFFKTTDPLTFPPDRHNDGDRLELRNRQS